MKYYEDQPPREAESDAVSLNRSDETYYRPFADKHLIYEAKNFYNCETIPSPYVCQESSLCSWDNSIRSCFYAKQITHDIRFKQSNLRKKNGHKKSSHKNHNKKHHH